MYIGDGGDCVFVLPWLPGKCGDGKSGCLCKFFYSLGVSRAKQLRSWLLFVKIYNKIAGRWCTQKLTQIHNYRNIVYVWFVTTHTHTHIHLYIQTHTYTVSLLLEFIKYLSRHYERVLFRVWWRSFLFLSYNVWYLPIFFSILTVTDWALRAIPI
jgi:hypothetical protein